MRFPSPQGGSETLKVLNPLAQSVKFPSPQGGSETKAFPLDTLRSRHVSIPSRRVGDRKPRPKTPSVRCGFHPLKAGRRPVWASLLRLILDSFHPLKAGRRRRRTHFANHIRLGFHPLKAGRRLKSPQISAVNPLMFPSPQGGSETWRLRSFIVRLVKVSIPSRRVGDGCVSGGMHSRNKVSIPSRRVGDYKSGLDK